MPEFLISNSLRAKLIQNCNLVGKFSLIFSSIRLLFKKPWYLLLAILLSIFLFAVYFVVNNFSVFSSIFAISKDPGLLFKVLTNQIIMVWGIAGPINVLAIGLVSLLAGINISLTTLRTRATKVFIGRPNLLTFLGSFGGAFGAACTACNTSLIALLGVSGGLAFFPLRGLEFSLLSLVLLFFSLYYVSKSIVETGITQ